MKVKFFYERTGSDLEDVVNEFIETCVDHLIDIKFCANSVFCPEGDVCGFNRVLVIYEPKDNESEVRFTSSSS